MRHKISNIVLIYPALQTKLMKCL